MTGTTLPETPRPPSSIYSGRGDEVDPFRPVFTGDVYATPERTEPFIVLQHPCALRVEGVNLVERVLVATVAPSVDVLSRAKIRSDWAAESMRVMPLPQLFGDERNWVADFRLVNTVQGGELEGRDRIATLSLTGVNLLQQRWVRHNSRVVIPTGTFAEQITGPYDEADLAAEWQYELEDEPSVGETQFHDFAAWITSPMFEGDPRTRQQMLVEPQSRPSVRREMTQAIRDRQRTSN